MTQQILNNGATFLEQRTKLNANFLELYTSITSLLTQSQADALYAALSHGHTSLNIADFTEAVQDVVGALVVAAGGTYNDPAGTITFPGGGGGGVTNLAYTPSPTQGVVTSDTGADATLPLADATNAGLMAPAQFTKLADVATGATANSTDATLLNRVNHTGTQLASTISNFSAAADARITAAVGTSVAALVSGKVPSSQLPASTSVSAGPFVVSNYGTRVFNLGTVAANGPTPTFLSGSFLNDGSDVGTEAIALELGEFTEVALIYGNVSPCPMIITGALAASPADFTDKVQDSIWATAPAFTFNGGATSVTIPPGNGSHPRLFCTDFLSLASVTRTDVVGGTPLLYARTRFALPLGSSHLTSSWDATGADWGTGRFQLYTAAMYGDKLTTTATRTTVTANRRVILGVRYKSPYRVMTVMCNGTSLTNNNNSTLSRQPGGWVTAVQQTVSTPTRPVEMLGWGMSGQTSTQYRGAFETNFKTTPFTHALIEGFDTNGSAAAFVQSSQDTNMRNVIAIAQQCEQVYKARVGMWGGLPRGNGNSQTPYYTTQGDLNRLAYLAKLQAQFKDDYCDISSAVVVPSSAPQLFKSVANGFPLDLSNDWLHPNQNGIDVLAPVFSAFVQAWADSYFTN